jgi:glycosyltransferase involved in cell wall biosynthesis
MTELHVFHVIDGLGTGGAERSLVEMVPALADRGVRSTIWALQQRGRGVERTLDNTYDVRHQLTRSPLPAKVRVLRRAITDEAPDVVHTTLFTASTVGRLAAVGRSPVLTSLVNTPYDPVRRFDRRLRGGRLTVVRAADRGLSRLTTHFHAISHAVADAAVRDLHIPRDRITVIPRGREVARLQVRNSQELERIRSTVGVTPTTPLVVNAARQEYQKGQRYLLEAAAAVRRTHPDLVVLVCGRDGAMTADLQRLHRELRLGETVRFLGHRDDLPDLVAASRFHRCSRDSADPCSRPWR